MQAPDEDTGDDRALFRHTGLLLDDRRQDQRLLHGLQGQALFPPLPLGLQHIDHGLVGTLQELDIRRTPCQVVGIRQEAALRVLSWITQRRHDVLVCCVDQGMLEYRVRVYPVEHFPKRLSLNQR